MTARTIEQMPRKRKTYRLDERIVEAMSQVARSGGFKNPSSWLEHHLFVTLQNTGYIASGEEPLGETRGGDRSQSIEESGEKK